MSQVPVMSTLYVVNCMPCIPNVIVAPMLKFNLECIGYKQWLSCFRSRDFWSKGVEIHLRCGPQVNKNYFRFVWTMHSIVKGGRYKTRFYIHKCHRICTPLQAVVVAEGINTAYTAVLEGVPLCYTYSSHYILASTIAAE